MTAVHASAMSIIPLKVSSAMISSGAAHKSTAEQTSFYSPLGGSVAGFDDRLGGGGMDRTPPKGREERGVRGNPTATGREAPEEFFWPFFT